MAGIATRVTAGSWSTSSVAACNAPSVADFDGELYLRLAAERLLLYPVAPGQGRGQGSGWSTPVIEIAAALVAVDALDADTAHRIAEGYEIASQLRGHEGSHGGLFRRHDLAPVVGAPLAPVRLAWCEHTVAVPWGSLTTHYALLAANSTVVGITATPTDTSTHAMRNFVTTMADEQGTQVQAHFSGQGGPVIRGQFGSQPGLDPTTRWIALDGVRLELGADVVPTAAVIEELPATTPAHRHLASVIGRAWQGGPRRVPETSIDLIIEALVAAGTMPVDDAFADQTRALVRAGQTGGSSSSGLPEPWASVVRRRAERRLHDREQAVWVIPVGAVTPSIDGAFVRIDTVELERREVSATIAVSPGSALGTFDPIIGTQEISWWATDDRGNHYLGHFAGGGGSAEGGDGTIRFGPLLDPAATVLRLLPTGSTERAVVEVALPGQGARP